MQENRLWKEICRSNPKIEASFEDERNWKQEYIKQLDLEVPELKYIAAVVARKDTGDEWLTHISHLGSWQESFKKDMKEMFHMQLTGERNGKIIFEPKSVRVGHYRFFDEIEANWIETYEKYSMRECPYVGVILGFIQFSVEAHGSKVLEAITSVARGVLAEACGKNYILCVRKVNVRIVNMVDRGTDSRFWEELGVLIHPKKTKKRVKYLNDVVDLVNATLSPLERKTRRDLHKVVKRVVEYSTGQVLYPFAMNVDLLVPDFASRLGEPYVPLWVYNFSEIMLVAGEDYYLT